MITRRSFLTTLALIPTVAQIPLQAAPQAAGEACDSGWVQRALDRDETILCRRLRFTQPVRPRRGTLQACHITCDGDGYLVIRPTDKGRILNNHFTLGDHPVVYHGWD